MAVKMNQPTAILLLAAGSSSRMGMPKLVQKIGDRSLFQSVITTLKQMEACSKAVVVGASKELILPQIPSDYSVIVNESWEEGLSASIKAGIEYIEKHEESAEQVLIVLGDMPLVTSEYLDLMINTSVRTQKGIIASDYGPSLGPPVIFSRKYFPELLKIKGDKGAKSVFEKFKNDLITLEFPDGMIDIDTPEDLLKFQKR